MLEEQTVEDKAKHLGWVPQEQWRDKPDKWVDAETFVERGESIMPILKKNNEQLHGKVSALEGQLQTVTAALAEAKDSISALVEHQTEATQKAVEDAKRNLKTQLREAKKNGDMDTQFELEDQIEEIDQALKAPTLPAPPQTRPAAPAASVQESPEFIGWKNDNTWFGQDRKKTALMAETAREMREDPANNSLKGRAFFNEAQRRVEEYLAPPSRTGGKVESGGGGGGGGGPRGRSFADLPADAKAACTKQGERLVGPNKVFKDQKAWQAHYVQQYFLGEGE